MQLLFQLDHNRRVSREMILRFAHDRLHDAALEAFCISVFDGVQQHRGDIDRRLTAAAENWRLHRMAAVDRNVLRLGAYELLQTPTTPPKVVIDEAIELARRFGSADSPSFVNGVLDRLLQDISKTPKQT